MIMIMIIHKHPNSQLVVSKSAGLTIRTHILIGQEVVWIGYNGSSREEEEPKAQQFQEKGYIPVYLDPDLAK